MPLLTELAGFNDLICYKDAAPTALEFEPDMESSDNSLSCGSCIS